MFPQYVVKAQREEPADKDTSCDVKGISQRSMPLVSAVRAMESVQNPVILQPFHIKSSQIAQ